MKTLIIPDNIHILFENFCEGCELCKITTKHEEEPDALGYYADHIVVFCEHIAACSRAFYMEGVFDLGKEEKKR